MSDLNNTLRISENFYSIQGEGKSSGFPSYFIRLGKCNLMCGGKGGALMKTGHATWWCDTEEQWRKSEPVSFDDLISMWKRENIFDKIMNGDIHIIWTGGEPTLPGHQKSIVSFLKYLEDMGGKPYCEIETNGTILIQDELFERLDQINCSPKLANSGIPEKDRVKEVPLRKILSHSNHQFKFVISKEEDMNEIISTFVNPLSIKSKNVVLMPALDNRENFHEGTRLSMEMAKKYGFIGLTRLHISAYDMTTGV